MKRRRAFTLIEMVMAVAITAITGVCIAGASMALSTAYDSGQEYYECIQTGRVTMLRLEQMLRQSLLVTDTRLGSLWIWREDTDGNGQINLSELSTIVRDPRTQELVEVHYEVPDYFYDYGFDDSIELHEATATQAVTFLQYYSSYVAMTVLAENVSYFEATVSPEAPLTKTVGVTLTIGQGGRELTIRTAVNLRADQTDRVAWVPYDDGGHWMLVN